MKIYIDGYKNFVKIAPPKAIGAHLPVKTKQKYKT